MATKQDGQLGMDETVIDDPHLERLLDERAKVGDQVAAVRARYEEADEKARAALSELVIPENGAIRVGRWRIDRQVIAAASVSFERAAKERVRISMSEADG